MGQRIGGDVCYIKADGINLTVSGDMTTGGGFDERESKVKGYYTEKETIPFISGTIINSKEVSLEQLYAATNATITVDLKNGKTRILRNAYIVGTIEENHTDGTVSLKWEGIKGGRWD